MARRGGSGELIKWGILIGGGYLAYTKARTGDFGAEPKKIADSINGVLGKLGLNWGGSPIGMMTYEAACAAARAEMVRLGGNWKSATCAEIAAHLKADPTIFVAPNAIRTALGA